MTVGVLRLLSRQDAPEPGGPVSARFEAQRPSALSPHHRSCRGFVAQREDWLIG